ncbi:hypothetical protein MBRA1_003104 [Malassezia brasiliensis]|uniref:Uncharacterized protein n=1 Tax=Malassezia brasiliensis TaxID=1821822 RepID=A0AAF0DVZ8_9BASI|nr:hypothetical protein MBRA1_003104 [Malassezia brasiliensis]
MLLGRVYYQNALVEPVLVWGALGAHLVASAVRAALLPARRTTGKARRWDWAQWQRVAGYVLAPVLLIHIWTNRVAPSRDIPPISALSPSELELSYVGYAFRTPRFAARTTVLYALLIAATAVHWIGGLPKMSELACWLVR